MDSIRRGSLINLGTRVLAVALGLAITLYTARLGTSQQGAFALFTAVEAVLLALVSGFGVAIARRISHHGEQPAGLVSACVLACLAIGSVVAAALALVSGHADEAYRPLWLLAVAAPLMFVPANLSGLWLGSGRMGGLARLTLGAPVLVLAGLALAWVLGWPQALFTVLAIWVAARVGVALAVLVAARRGGWLARPDFSALSAEWRFVGVIGLTNLVGLLNYKIDIFLVERLLGLSATGVYSIAVMVAELLWLVSSSVTTAAYARIGTPDAPEAARITVRAVHASVLLLAALCPALWLGAALLVPPLLGEAYRPALVALAVLLPGVAVYGAASALSAWFTNHAGRPLVPALLATASLMINVVVSLVAIPRLGMVGGALATTLSYGVTVALAAMYFLRASGTPAAVLLRPDWRAFAADFARWRERH
jgi:O-antigen/teichoic acid export membrane protein